MAFANLLNYLSKIIKLSNIVLNDTNFKTINLMSDFYLMESIKAEDAIALDRLMYCSSAKSFLDGMDIQLRTYRSG